MNAKEEFLKATEGKNVKCCEIYLINNGYNKSIVTLPVNFSNEDYFSFLESINKDYGNDFLIQELEGTIWLDDGTWIERHGYDGSEGWTWKKTPQIPDYLQPNEDIVTINGVEYQFIENNTYACSACSLIGRKACTKVKCTPDERTDNKNGIYKLKIK